MKYIFLLSSASKWRVVVKYWVRQLTTSAIGALVVVAAQILSTSAFAQSSTTTVATFTGTFATPGQQDQIQLDVTKTQFTFNGANTVSLTFIMRAADGSVLNPGLIGVIKRSASNAQLATVRKPSVGGDNSSIAITALTEGSYDVTVRGEQRSVGAYQLEVLLTGDANNDLQVDQADLESIRESQGSKFGGDGYNAFADVDRNGVINDGDYDRARANLGAGIHIDTPSNPVDEPLHSGALSLLDAFPDSFISRTQPLRFSLTGATFDLDRSEIVLTVNGVRQDVATLTVEDHLLIANATLFDGKNDYALKAYDTVGRPLYLSETRWAGESSLLVELVNPDGSPYLSPADVTLTLSDDTAVGDHGTSTNGTILFQNLPSRTLLIFARGIDNAVGSIGVVGGQTSVQKIVMLGFSPPSPVSNNDFSLGTLGWNVANAFVTIDPHLEIIPGFDQEQSQPSTAMGITAQAIIDQDLTLTTPNVQGPTSISRAFQTQPGTSGVSIRYRFITTEVPGGFFGSEFNDGFSVKIRSKAGGGFAGETNSMNSLGLAAFHFDSGSTNWRSAIIPVKAEGDVIQVDVTVENVGDGAFQSQVVVDFVDEIRNEVRPQLSWNNTAGGLRLNYEVVGEITAPVDINIYWAAGTGYGNRIGEALFTHAVPAGTSAGTHGPIAVPGTLLITEPTNATHILAASSPLHFAALMDVRLTAAATANMADVSAGMRDIVRDGFRVAGLSAGVISSTARSPFDQARVMFQALTGTSNLAANIASQIALYAAPGEAVVQRFVTETENMSYQEILDNSTAIRAAMEAEVNAQGPVNVSRHCADPALMSVIDLGRSQFNTQNGLLYEGHVDPRLTEFLVEAIPNNAYHHQLDN